MTTITQNLLLELFDYDPETGILTNKITRNYNCLAGEEAGTLSANSKGDRYYRKVFINRKGYKTHRLIYIIMTGEEAEVIDHINGDSLDNRWCNLQNGTQADNTKNQSKRKDNKSGVVGVCWDKSASKWNAYITVKQKHIFLGYFTDFDEAVAVRKAAEKEYNFHLNHGRT